jgi:hypothetical protein
VICTLYVDTFPAVAWHRLLSTALERLHWVMSAVFAMPARSPVYLRPPERLRQRSEPTLRATSRHGSVALLSEEERTVEKRVMKRLDWRACWSPRFNGSGRRPSPRKADGLSLT